MDPFGDIPDTYTAPLEHPGETLVTAEDFELELDSIPDLRSKLATVCSKRLKEVRRKAELRVYKITVLQPALSSVARELSNAELSLFIQGKQQPGNPTDKYVNSLIELNPMLFPLRQAVEQAHRDMEMNAIDLELANEILKTLDNSERDLRCLLNDQMEERKYS